MTEKTYFACLQNDAQLIAAQAAKLLQRQQKSMQILHTKVDAGDLVTSADIASETLILRQIHKKYPDHAILSEEAGRSSTKSQYLWVVDPLDGTKEYARGLSEYNCLISIERGDSIVAGVIHCVGIGDVYAASKGNGAQVNAKRIYVSDRDNFELSFIGFHPPERSFAPDRLAAVLSVFKKITQTAYRVRPGWNDAKLLGWVARGALDAHIIPAGLHNAWGDFSSGILLVQEAGGKVTDWGGAPLKNHDLSNGIVASNGKIHEKILKIIERG